MFHLLEFAEFSLRTVKDEFMKEVSSPIDEMGFGRVMWSLAVTAVAVCLITLKLGSFHGCMGNLTHAFGCIPVLSYVQGLTPEEATAELS